MLGLRLRLLLSHWHPVAVMSAMLCIAALAALVWLAHARALLDQQRVLALQTAALPVPVATTAAPPAANENLALFYSSLGERRYAEQQVKALFGIATGAGLLLREGEYKLGYDKNARVHTYQITLPVKGSYPAIWKFAMEALRAIPFASLDEISFRRDVIGDPAVEARLRLTLYLSGAPEGGER
jgi:hypothetical protein